MVYEIFEGNMERLEKKLNRIYNKCKAYDCSFHYAQVGETFKELEDENGNRYTARFIQVEAEGKVVINNWEFVAAVEHTENGNIFRSTKGVEIPERYYRGKPVCEHCNSNRYRKYTYIIRNNKTGEFKQVGKSCLKDFTHGMSAEYITQYMSLFDTLIEGRTPEEGCYAEHYLNVREYLAYAAETIRHFGYVKSGEDNRSTAYRALEYYEANKGRTFSHKYLEQLMKEMDSVKFDADSQETVQLVDSALEWIAGQDESNNYMHNLKTVCSLEYAAYKIRPTGLLASLFIAYDRDKKKKAEQQPAVHSEYVGKVGEKITVPIHSFACITSYETQYGIKRIYRFVSTEYDVLIWKTGVVIEENQGPIILTGTVKGFSEFRGEKQTELTRCHVAGRK